MIRAHGNGQVQRRRSTHLEELHADASKHELQKGSDDQDVADGFDRHEHTLHNVLWAHKRKQFRLGNTIIFSRKKEGEKERPIARKTDRKADRKVERKKEKDRPTERKADQKAERKIER